jgi:hypothetical protein
METTGPVQRSCRGAASADDLVLWGKRRIGAEALTLVASLKISFVRGNRGSR